MNNKDVLNVVKNLATEHKISEDLAFEAVEKSAAIAARKELFSDQKVNITVSINKKTGDLKVFRNYVVVDDNEENFDQLIHLYQDQAEEKFGYLSDFGETLVEQIAENIEFSRVSAHVFKLGLRENIRQAIKDNAQEKFKDLIGCIFNVKVVKFSKGDVFVSVNDDVDGVIKKSFLQKTDRFKIGQTITVVLNSFDSNYKGHQLMFDRNSSMFIEKVIGKEVPEIQDGDIVISNVVVSKKTNKVIVGLKSELEDPISVCIGVRGQRIKSIKKAVGSFHIEFVVVENEITDTLRNIFKTKMLSAIVDENDGFIDVALSYDDYSQLNTKNENGELLMSIDEKSYSEFFGMTVKFYTKDSLEEKQKNIDEYYINLFSEKLDLDLDISSILVYEGFDSFETIRFTDLNDYLEIDGFNEDIALEIKKRAKEVIELDEKAKDLSDFKLCTKNIVDVLNKNDVYTIQDLADLSNIELQDIISLKQKDIDELIMKARDLTIL